MEVRTACPDDGTAVIDLWRRFTAEECPALPDDTQGPDLEAWSTRLDAQLQQGKLLVAERYGAVAGFVGFIDAAEQEWVPEGIAYLVDLYVVPEARRTNAARTLFHALIERLVYGGYNEVWANTSAADIRAQFLLRRARFVPLGDFQIPGLSDQLYFRKTLGIQFEAETPDEETE